MTESCSAHRASFAAVQSLAAQFPGSDWVTNAAATAQYNLRNFDEAQELFEDLLERDPHRIEVRQTAAVALTLHTRAQCACA